MYIPRANEEKRVPAMQSLMRAQPFGTLVTLQAAPAAPALFASHIPMVLEDDGSEFGVLKGHVARGNAQWRNFDAGVEALAIFAGDHHYISASWYPDTKEEVPTWNYVVVHAYGTLRAVQDPEWLLAHVTSLSDIHEAASAEPWKVTDAPKAFIDAEIRAIVGLELPVRRLEGKWKVSQNRNELDRAAVVRGLTDLNTPESLAMRHLVCEAAKK